MKGYKNPFSKNFEPWLIKPQNYAYYLNYYILLNYTILIKKPL